MTQIAAALSDGNILSVSTEMVEARREALQELHVAFKNLEKDPIILGLKVYCREKGAVIPCTDTWKVEANTDTGKGDLLERRIVLTKDGFKVQERSNAPAWFNLDETKAFTSQDFPFDRLKLLGLEPLIEIGAIPHSAKEALSRFAQGVTWGGKSTEGIHTFDNLLRVFEQ